MDGVDTDAMLREATKGLDNNPECAVQGRVPGCCTAHCCCVVLCCRRLFKLARVAGVEDAESVTVGDLDGAECVVVWR